MSSTKNLTSGPPLRLIVVFTLPLLVGNVFQQLYQFTDAAVVGRLLGVNSLAAVGATGSLCFFLIGFSFGASNGLAIPTAKAFGAGDMAAMRRYVTAGIRVSIWMAVAISAAGLTCSRLFLRLLQTPPELVAEATVFLAVTFCGAAATVAFNFLAATIRALGDSRTPLIFLVVACCLNALLVVVYIAVFHMGVGGAAAATVTAQLVSVLFCLLLIGRRMPELRLKREDWKLRPGELRETATLGLAMGFQMSIIAIGALVLQYAINGLGADAVAAYTVAMRVDQVAVTPLSSFGVSIATFTAQNRGAFQWRRIRVGVFRTTMVSLGVALVLGALILAFGTSVVRVFVGAGEDEVVAMAHQYLIINGCLYVFLALVFLLRNVIQGLGVSSVPTVAGVMELLFRTAAGLILVAQVGFLGACLAAPLAWLGALIPIVPAWYFWRRRLIRLEAEGAAA
jgi:putative MATE family efflux protein